MGTKLTRTELLWAPDFVPNGTETMKRLGASKTGQRWGSPKGQLQADSGNRNKFLGGETLSFEWKRGGGYQRGLTRRVRGQGIFWMELLV